MPEAIDHINVDGYSKVTHEADGVPNEVKNPQEMVDEKRQQRAEQMAREQQMSDLERGANVAGEFAGAAKDLLPQTASR
jgi:hypothetical protein